MKQFLNIFYIAALTTGLFACGRNDKKVTENLPQGKVKFNSISVASKIAGRIEVINIKEGQQVHKGDTLMIIGVPELNAKLEQAAGAITAAQGQLDLARDGATTDQLTQIQGQLDAAVAQMDFAEQSMQRMQNMYNDSLVPAQQYDEVRSKYKAAQAQVKAIKAKQQEVRAGARPETIKSATGQVTRAIGARNEVLQANKERYILAPADMTIETIALSEGELATPGYALVTGFDNSGTYFRFTIGESAINAYHIDDAVTIAVPNTNKKIKGKIVAIKQMPRYADNTSTAPNRQVAEGFFEVKVVAINIADAGTLYNNSTVMLSK